MLKKILSCFLAVSLSLTAAFGTNAPKAAAAENDDFQIMFDRCYEQTVGAKPGETLDTSNPYIKAFVDSVNEEANGYWETMNKSDDTGREEIWPGIKPVVGSRPNTATADLTTTYKYLNKLAQAYATPGTDLYQNRQVPEEIFSAIDFTLENDWFGGTTYNPYGNWWDHRIGVPAQLLPTMVLLRDELTDDQFNRYMTAMKNQKGNDWSGYTAANKADISLNALYMAILEKDADMLNKIKESLGSDMFSYTTGNGWHKDGSYIDHNMYAYTGGYGSVLITAMEKMMPIVKGTAYELTYGDERDTFYDEIIFNNYIPVHYAGRIFDMVSGRSITRVTAQDRQSAGQLAVFADALSPDKAEELRAIVKMWLLEDPDIMGNLTKPAELTACIKILNDDSIVPTNIPEGYYRFADMDKYVQHNETYSVGLALHSDKIANYEWGNEEGRKLWNTSDGAIYINNADVNQFKDNFWPTVNHLRIPGVTTLYDGDRSDNAGYGSKNPNNWVGGVDMGNIGIAGMQIKTLGSGSNRDGLLAKKSYFMFDDEVVALGSDIQALSNLGLPAETVVENRKINNDLSNKLLFNGEEIDVIDNSAQEEVVNDQYVKIYTDPTAEGDYHNITHALSADASKVTVNAKMRFNDSWRNAGVRIMGTDAEGNKQKAFEVAMFTNQQVFLRTFNDGEPADGKMLFAVPDRTNWWDLEATLDVATHALTVKVTAADGSVLAETSVQANEDVTAISSFDLFNTTGYINEFDFKSLKVSTDNTAAIDLDFTQTTADEWKAMDGWEFQCIDADGNVKDEQCASHNLYSITTVSNVTKTQLRKGIEVPNVSWAHLEGNVEGSDIGYYFPEATDLLAVKSERTGSWKDINDLKNWGHDDLPPYTRGYAEMVIDHGVLTTEDSEHPSYGYVLLPGKSADETKAYNDNPDIEILANDAKIHAVRENSLGVTGLNCWTSAGATVGGITVNRYASVMWKETDTTYELVVCDPTHTGTAPITLSIADAKIQSVISKDDKITVNSAIGADTLELTVDVSGTERSQQYTAVFEKDVPATATEVRELRNAVYAAKNLPADSYTASTYAALTEAVSAAEALYAEGREPSQMEVQNALAAIQTARENLVNISTLKVVIDLANGYVEAGALEGLVPTVVEQFNNILAEAEAVYANPDATQAQADNAWKKLMTAMHALGFEQGDKTDLAALVAQAENLNMAAYEDGAEKDAFKAALKAAQEILADPDAMKADIDAAYTALQTAMDNLIPAELEGDKSQLQKVYDEAITYDLDQYVDDMEAKAAFTAALEAAKEVLDKEGATQGEIDKAWSDLLNAMDALRLRADKTTLNEWLERLKAYDLSKYTEESAAAVRVAISEAEALAAQDLSEDDEDLIRAAVAKMMAAEQGLELKAEEPDPGDDSSAPAEPSEPGDENSSSKPDDGSSSDSQAGSSSEQVGASSGDKETPTTGDAAPIAAVSLLAVAAAGVLLALKRRKENE